MMTATTIHGCHDKPLHAEVEAHPDAAWLTLRIGSAAWTIFMPAERAQRLANAINSAETRIPPGTSIDGSALAGGWVTDKRSK